MPYGTQPETISIHALREEGDLELLDPAIVHFEISIHALREEGDRRQSSTLPSRRNFYPRPPRGGRRQREAHRDSGRAISIHALREEGDRQQPYKISCPQGISIHALREEGDVAVSGILQHLLISIHALREEGDAISIFGSAMDDIFLSTPSARRATAPTSVCAVWPKISIHALREEGDQAGA